MSDNQIFLFNKNNKKYFCIVFSYDSAIVDAVRLIPSRKFDGASKRWFVIASPLTSKYIELFAQKMDFTLSDDAIKYINYWKKSPDEIVIPKLKKELRQFQKTGVEYAVKYKKCFIADQQGLGKTIESICSVEYLQAYPCLVVCPASLKYNWEKEVKMWTDRKAYVINGMAHSEMTYEDADFIIINYELLDKKEIKQKIKKELSGVTLKGHKDILKTMEFKSIICDESFALMNSKSLRTQAVSEISKNLPIKYLLSGTPVQSRPKELISQLSILDMLDSFGGYNDFAIRYCDAKKIIIGKTEDGEYKYALDINGASNLLELNNKLKVSGFIRRLKTDVLEELPEKQIIKFPLEINNMKEYKSLTSNFKQWIESTTSLSDSDRNEILSDDSIPEKEKKTLLTAKYKFKLTRKLKAEAILKITKLKQVIAEGKINQIIEIINNFVENGEKIIVFADHEKIYRKLIDKYGDLAVSIVGGMTAFEKNQSVEKFQNDDKVRIFIGAIMAASTGLTLTAASTVLFTEFAWSPKIHEQCEDRAHRIGQKDFVKCYYFYGKDTIDEDILELLDEKNRIVDSITDGVEVNNEPDATDIEKIMRKIM